MREYQIIKGKGRTMWMVRAGEDLMRFYRRSECEAWIRRATRRDAEWEEEKLERNSARREAVKAYLALRAARKAESDRQGVFAF